MTMSSPVIKRPYCNFSCWHLLEGVMRITLRRVNPLGFLANLWLEGLEHWQEFDWLGYDIKIRDMTLALLNALTSMSRPMLTP